MLNLMFAELDQHIFPSEVKVVAEKTPGTGDLQVTENGKEINVNEVLQVAQSTEYSPTLLEKSCFNEVTDQFTACPCTPTDICLARSQPNTGPRWCSASARLSSS